MRAYDPWPVAYTLVDGQPLRVLACAHASEAGDAAPGTVFLRDGALCVATVGRGGGDLTRVQGPGGKPMSGAEYARGHAAVIGRKLVGGG